MEERCAEWRRSLLKYLMNGLLLQTVFRLLEARSARAAWSNELTAQRLTISVPSRRSRTEIFSLSISAFFAREPLLLKQSVNCMLIRITIRPPLEYPMRSLPQRPFDREWIWLEERSGTRSLLRMSRCLIRSAWRRHRFPVISFPLILTSTPCDNSKTNKESVSRTYKCFDGYAPIMAYIGDEGFLANTELREGKQHSQKGMPYFLREILRLAHQMVDQQLLVRMDSGNDVAENLGILIEDSSWFVIKRNMRRGETKEGWLEKVQGCYRDIRHPREGKTVYIGSSRKDVPYKTAGGEKRPSTSVSAMKSSSAPLIRMASICSLQISK